MSTIETTATAVRGSKTGFMPLLRQGLGAHALFGWLVGIYVLTYAAFLLTRPQFLPPDMVSGFFLFIACSLPFLLFSIVLMRLYHIARHVKPKSPLRGLGSDLKAYFTDRQRLANGLPMLLAFIGFGYVFVFLKSDVFLINGFKWDLDLAELDRALHFGADPWRWLQPLLGYPIVTFALNLVYNLWFFVMWAIWAWFGFAKHGSELRTRFFLTFFITWMIGGNLMAIYFSSAGPCFFDKLGHAGIYYADLMAYLHEANRSYPIWAVSLQDLLWEGHKQGSLMEEISAMPSMHNGSSLLFALAVYPVSRFWGRVLAANAALIFLGSIMLAWHYAVDAYVAWALCLAVWFAMAPVARWWHAREAQASFDTALAAQG
jgi:PAP2 superfamily